MPPMIDGWIYQRTTQLTGIYGGLRVWIRHEYSQPGKARMRFEYDLVYPEGLSPIRIIEDAYRRACERNGVGK